MKKQKKESRPLTPEDFFELREVGDARISPDGSVICYTVQEIDRAKNSYKRSLWLVETVKGKARQFSSAPGGNDSNPRWSPRGDEIAFLSSRSGTSQIWLIHLHGGEARCLTSMPRGIEAFRWSPDGRYLAFLSRMNGEETKEFIRRRQYALQTRDKNTCESEEEKQREKDKHDPRLIDRIVYRTGTSYRDDRRTHLFILDTKNSLVDQITRDDRDYSLPCWSTDSTFLVSTANFTGDEDNDVSTDLVRIDRASHEQDMLTRDIHENSQPVISPDGRFCAFLSLSAERPSCHNTVVKVLDLENPSEIRDITGFLDRDVVMFRFAPDGASIYGLVPDRGNTPIARFSLQRDQVTWMTDGQHFVLDFDIDARGDVIAYTQSTPLVPSDIMLLDCRTAKSTRLTDTNKTLLQKRFLSEPEELTWKADDGLEVQGWVMKPLDFKKNKKHPLIVQIHGGPHIMWGNSFWLEFQIMASRGYVVFFSNPRGSDGYGETFKSAIYQSWGINDSRDILSGLEHVIEAGYVDKKQLNITGGSYGGFMTAWIIGHDKRFRAAVAQRGVYNLTSFYGCSDAQLLIEWEFDTFPWDNPELLWQHSPLAYVTSIDTPLLIIHSELDYRAPINTAEELFTALKKLKREVLFVRYPREGHELSRSGEPAHRVDRLSRIVGWFDQHRP